MLEATANFIGKDGFNWWVGQVENDGGDQNDPDYTNKVKVRILGYHSPSKEELSTKDLPWAMVSMPTTQAQRGGMGSVHQLQVNSWVIGFFMDGASSQIPIVLGSIGDENPEQGYKRTGTQGFAQLLPPTHDERHHGTGGSVPPGTASTVAESPTTGLAQAASPTPLQIRNNTEFLASSGADTKQSRNSRGGGQPESAAMKAADKRKCTTVHVGNGKCGSEATVKIEGALAEFMKFARGIEKNEINKFIDKETGKVVDFMAEVNATANRISSKLNTILGNIKGTVLKEVDLFIKKILKDLNIPDPDIAEPVKEQLKTIGDLIACLFKSMLGDLVAFIKGMLLDLVEKALDTALCLVQSFIGEIMGKIMDLIQQAMGFISGILGKITGAIGMIQGLLSKILDFIDLLCDGAVSCSLGLTTFETCNGANAKGDDKKQKNVDQYKVKPPSDSTVVGDGKPNGKGFVPLIDSTGKKFAYNANTGEKLALEGATSQEDFKNSTGIDEGSFDTRGPLQKFTDFNIYASDGSFNEEAVNCSNSILNKEPCFPEMIWDNLQSTTPVKALPIVDDIGSILGVLIQNKGYEVNAEASVKAMFTCNEPEGKGATFSPVIVDGRVERIDVTSSGVGYGFNPGTSYCPKEQYVVIVKEASSLKANVSVGDVLLEVETADGVVSTTQPAVMQVVDTDYEGSGDVLLATLDITYNKYVQPGLKLKTKSGYEFELNFASKKAQLVIPPDATAIYAGCSDIIPILTDVTPTFVGKNYTDPKIVVGDEEIGDATIDSEGKIVKLNLNKKTLGFVKPKIVDPTGYGARIVPVYEYAGPIQTKETLPLKEYIDCVGHPALSN